MPRLFVYVRSIDRGGWRLVSLDPGLAASVFVAQWGEMEQAAHYHALYNVELERKITGTLERVAHGDHLIVF
ncbi:hypothetical protein [uncultured Dubosiella sp.]|uniref:hypothetical protein n=1 Tax=uncultured Dubosiella sp. TaxID=1937011 RepID=UPI00272F2BBE|nr:hypothetical protein [uncultured Dubosiella sp.]